MAETKYIKPRVASTEIDIALDLFERDEAMKRITAYVNGLLDDAESQFKRAMSEAKNENSGLTIPVVSKRYSEKDVDSAYDKGFTDGVNSYNNLT